MSDSAVIDAPTEQAPANPQKPKDPRLNRLSTDQKAKAHQLYVINGKPNDEIAREIGVASGRVISNLAHREGWTRKRQQLERRIEKRIEKATESVLQRAEREFERAAPMAVALVAEGLENATEATGGKRVLELQGVKLALGIANDLTGRDRQSKDGQTTIHMHLSSAWSPRRVDAVDVETVESPATGLNSVDPVRGNQVRIADVARPE